MHFQWRRLADWECFVPVQALRLAMGAPWLIRANPESIHMSEKSY
jgi:hypothetical protein